MTINHVFHNNDTSALERRLVEDLIIEAIRQFGIDVYYIPRTRNNPDKLYGDDDISSFNQAFMIEMYVETPSGFGGDGQFLSKFGAEIRESLTFRVAERVFDDEIGNQINIPRPREGDLIFFPMNNKAFEIKFVDNKPVFYQFDQLPTYDMTCELFEYSHEIFNTGVPEIDAIQMKQTLNIYDYGIYTQGGLRLMTVDGKYLVKANYQIQTIDPAADNDAIDDLSDSFLNFSEVDPLAGNDGTY